LITDCHTFSIEQSIPQTLPRLVYYTIASNNISHTNIVIVVLGICLDGIYTYTNPQILIPNLDLIPIIQFCKKKKKNKDRKSKKEPGNKPLT